MKRFYQQSRHLSRYLSRYLLPILLSLSYVFSTDAVDELCLAADDKMLSKGRLQQSYFDMMKRFNSTCTLGENCDANIDPIELYLIHDYRNFGVGLMKSACERRSDRKMCRVTTKVKFSNIPGVPEFDVVDIGTYIVEVKKPVCFPPQCSDDQIHIVDPNPVQCRNGAAGDFDCEVVSYDVECPSRVTTSGRCKSNLLSPTSSFFIQQTLYQGAILADCASAASGNPTSYCKIGYGDLKGGITGDMREEFPSDPYFKKHEQRCKQARGIVCTADVKGSLTIPKSDMKEIIEDTLAASDFEISIGIAGKVVGKGDFQGMPQCFPPSCDFENDIPTLFMKHAEFHLKERNAPMSCEDGSDTCKMDVSNIQCKVPTNSPTKLPTVSPTLTLFPTPDDYTTAPTDGPTSSPTESPTKDPTVSPTALPTDDPTVSPTASPTTSPTALPTEDPTLNPSALPTEVPTDGPTVNPTAEETTAVGSGLSFGNQSFASITVEINDGSSRFNFYRVLWSLVFATAVVML